MNMIKKYLNKKHIVIYIAILGIGLVILPSMIKKIRFMQRDHRKEITLLLPQPNTTEQSLDTRPELKWQEIVAKNGDSLSHLFKRAKLSGELLQQWLALSEYKTLLAQITPKQTFSVLKENNKLKKARLYLSKSQYLELTHEQDHLNEALITLNLNKELVKKTFDISSSLLADSSKQKIPTEIIYQLLSIFKQKTNFSKDVHPGDSVTIVYETQSLGDELIKNGPILAASLKLKHKTLQAIRFGEDEHTVYYSPNGESLALGFDRYPIKFTHVGSVFNLHRFHPILHINRPHRGIDLAASLGTPIKAVADGIVDHIGPLGGYGNMVRIKHSRKYETVYAHMLRFKRGLKKGDRVMRGNIIGYVGQTGLATAPHCHFEFHINRKAVNPATVHLPHAASVAKNERQAFKLRAEEMLTLLEKPLETSVG